MSIYSRTIHETKKTHQFARSFKPMQATKEEDSNPDAYDESTSDESDSSEATGGQDGSDENDESDVDVEIPGRDIPHVSAPLLSVAGPTPGSAIAATSAPALPSASPVSNAGCEMPILSSELRGRMVRSYDTRPFGFCYLDPLF